MTPELVARVDAWIEARSPDGRGDALVLMWSHLGDLAWSASTEAGREAIAAAVGTALRGVLLAIVRWAWDDPRASVTPERGRPRGEWACCVQPPARQVGRMFVAGSEDEALVLTLEAAPRREASP